MIELVTLYPSIMKVLIGVIIGLFILNISHFKKAFGKIKMWAWLVLLAIFLIGLGARLFLVPHTHYMYYDEYEHVNMAQNILYSGRFCECYDGIAEQCNRCDMLGWPPGYAVLQSLVFAGFGDSEVAAFNTSAVIGALSIILMFLLTYMMLKSANAALIASLILSLSPVHLRFSGSTSPEIVSVFFVLASMICLELYLLTKEDGPFLLFLATLSYAVSTRPEYFILIITSLAYIAIRLKGEIFKLLNWKRLMAVILFFLMLIPFAIVIANGLVSFPEDWNPSLSTRWGWLGTNLPYNLASFFNFNVVPIAMILLAFIGCAQLWLKDKKALAYVLFFFSSFFGVYSLSRYGIFIQDSSNMRYFIIFNIPLGILAAAGANLIAERLKMKKAVILLVLSLILAASIIPCVPFIGSRLLLQDEYDTIISMRDRLPSEVYIVAGSPASIISTIHKKSISPYGIENRIANNTNIILFKDWIWYNHMSEKDRTRIEGLLSSRYDFSTIAEFRYGVFYNLTLKSPGYAGGNRTK